MTRKDYKLIAAAIAATPMYASMRHDLVLNMAARLEEDNPAFNIVKFKEACEPTDG